MHEQQTRQHLLGVVVRVTKEALERARPRLGKVLHCCLVRLVRGDVAADGEVPDVAARVGHVADDGVDLQSVEQHRQQDKKKEYAPPWPQGR